MQKVFYIFRHGETEYNKERRWQGCGIDMPLDMTGEAQAHELANFLQDKGLEIVYSSPLKRALQTAEVVVEKIHVPLKIIPDLREGCFGKVEGMLKTDIAKAYPEIFATWYEEGGTLDIGFPGGETKRQMQERMLKVLDELLKTKETVIGIASHGSSIRYLLMNFGHKPSAMKNTALFKLSFKDGVWALKEY